MWREFGGDTFAHDDTMAFDLPVGDLPDPGLVHTGLDPAEQRTGAARAHVPGEPPDGALPARPQHGLVARDPGALHLRFRDASMPSEMDRLVHGAGGDFGAEPDLRGLV